MTTQILADRLAEIEALALSSGSHEAFERGMCVMEACSYIAGEPWSDQPQCACPVITAFLISWNDSLPDDDRTRLLKPLIPIVVGTRSAKEVEERRSYMALDWLIRVYTPKWLDLVPSLSEHAKAMRDLDEIVDMAGAAAVGDLSRAAGDAARAAAGDAAGAAVRAAAWAAARAAAGDAAGAAVRAAAWAAAGDAAGDAARAAAGDAAWAAVRAAAGTAARDAAWAAAREAAGAAAGAAAGDAAGAAARAAARAAGASALRPTTEWLQASAVDLVKRMCEAKP